MIIVNAINKLLDLANPVTFDFGGRMYTSKGLVPVKEPLPYPLTVHTLSGLADYLTKKIDALNTETLVLHVGSPTEVNLLGYLQGASFCERAEFISAVFEPPQFRMGDYASLESFLIGIQAYFVQDANTAALLKVIGNIKDESVVNFSDNGVTQAVTAKTGISMVEITPVPNPVTLRPFRTFPEIEQPEGLFVFRMRQQEKQAPACGLWEADNKQWKIEAVKGIAAWLQERLPEIPIIA
jgi:hypothetical protein